MAIVAHFVTLLMERTTSWVGVLLIIGVIRIWATSSNRLGETAGNETGWLTFPLSSALSGVRSGLVLVTLAVLIMNWRPFWLLVSGVFRRPWHMIQLFGAFCVGSAGADEAMTELAKLEERWLKLDR